MDIKADCLQVSHITVPTFYSPDIMSVSIAQY